MHSCLERLDCFFYNACSELLYPDGSTSPTSGVEAEVLRNGRDYVVRWLYVPLYADLLNAGLLNIHIA